ncbi:MAG: HD domain-containing protein [Treponema sp.]|nr:HD domain-containing protein [Treponema sp.]MCL2250566.1 HD domain-containing protein [Treponema sp.]
MKNGFFNNLKSIFPKQLIVKIPPELQEQFDEIQLQNSIQRIRLLTIIAILGKIINVVFLYFTNDNLRSNGLFDLLDYSELAIIVLFNLAVIFFRKKNKKRILWILCYLLIASAYILYEFTINSAGTTDEIPFIFFVTIFLFTILPDFKPVVFITYAIIYLGATAYILMMKNQSFNDFFGLQSHILNIFLFIIITKILLYNYKVRRFVSTYEINKLNDNLLAANKEIENKKNELQNYNDNLEEIVLNKTETIVELKNAVMETIAELVECRDGSTGEHISRTSRYLKFFTNALLASGLYKEQTASWNIEQMVLSAQLHDVGKIAIDDSILRKPGKLTDEEFNTMKKHTLSGGEIIKKIQEKTGEREFLDYAFIFAVYHHEKWDGKGYPYGLAGEKIPLPARIMAIIDVYDALISERPYKKAFSHEEAIGIIKDGRGTHFDPLLTDLFVSVFDKFNDFT